MNQGKLDMAKQQLARLNDHGRFRNSELKWVGMGEFNPDDHYIYYYGKERRVITNSSRKNEAATPKWKRHSVVDVSGGE